MRTSVKHSKEWNDRISKAMIVHGMEGTPTYNSWRGMKRRCLNPRATNFRWYGERGVKICERWLDFQNFLADMGCKPNPSLTIERINNDRGYEPGNCRWATRQEQCKNRGGIHAS